MPNWETRGQDSKYGTGFLILTVNVAKLQSVKVKIWSSLPQITVLWKKILSGGRGICMSNIKHTTNFRIKFLVYCVKLKPSCTSSNVSPKSYYLMFLKSLIDSLLSNWNFVYSYLPFNTCTSIDFGWPFDGLHWYRPLSESVAFCISR